MYTGLFVILVCFNTSFGKYWKENIDLSEPLVWSSMANIMIWCLFSLNEILKQESLQQNMEDIWFDSGLKMTCLSAAKPKV